jgi:hypothetical protein
MIARRIVKRARGVLVALALAVGLTAVGPALSATAAVPAAGPLAMKACAPAPEPAKPTAGLPGKIYGEPATASNGDPFAEGSSTTIADVYGYGYRWQDYDNGCLPGGSQVAGVMTGIGNFVLAMSASVNAFTHGTLGLVVAPTWLEPLDQTLTQATQAVKEGMWTPWLAPMMILVAVLLLIAAARADVSKVVTSFGWALIVLVGTTYLMSYPVSSAQAVDGLIGASVTGGANAMPGADGADTPQQALNAQFNTVNEHTLYSAWLEGTLGSSTNELARNYGPDLFKASHLTWSEAATVENDPAAGKAIIEQKKNLWTETAAKVEQADPAAYQQLTGNQGRWDSAFSLGLQTAITMPFLLVAGVFVVIAYLAIRVFVPLAPAIGVFGMLNVAQGWVIGVMGQVGRMLIMGPLFWLGALINLFIISAVLARPEVPFVIRLIICLVIPILLFKLLRPKSSVPGMGRLGGLLRAGAQHLLMRRAVAGGVSDGVADAADDATPPADPTPPPGPVATPTARPEYALPSSPSRYELPPGNPGVPRHRNDVVAQRRGTDVTARGGERYPHPTFVPQGTHADPQIGASRRPAELDAAPVPSYDAPADSRQQHPAIAGIESSEPYQGPRHEAPTIAPSTDEDLAAPAQVMNPFERVPQGAHEAPVEVVDGEEVFVIWRPEGARSTHNSDEREGF